MNNKKILFPFSAGDEHLKDKWWHRLFSVVYVVSITLFALGAVLVSSESVNDSTSNSQVLNNLRGFSASSEVSLSNTIPNFLKQNAKFGCIQDSGEIYYISTYSLQNSSYCTAELTSHLPDAADMIIRNGSTRPKDTLIAVLTEIMRKDAEKRYCFIDKDVSCVSDKIVAYNHSIVFYLLIGFYSLIATYLFSISLQLIYFKGLIYVIYGKKSNA